MTHYSRQPLFGHSDKSTCKWLKVDSLFSTRTGESILSAMLVEVVKMPNIQYASGGKGILFKASLKS